jgi:hypothetical protein
MLCIDPHSKHSWCACRHSTHQALLELRALELRGGAIRQEAQPPPQLALLALLVLNLCAIDATGYVTVEESRPVSIGWPMSVKLTVTIAMDRLTRETTRRIHSQS